MKKCFVSAGVAVPWFAEVRTPQELQETADDLFAVIASGKVKIAINQRHALKDAAKAQEELAAKKTTGATILVP